VKRFLWITIVAVVLAIPFSIVLTQDETVPPVTLDIIGVTSTDLSNVTINTSVLDATGQSISGLGIENFRVGGALAESATITSVTNVTDDNLAVASVLVIDTSTSMSGLPMDTVKQAARNYVEAIGESDPVAVVAFDSTVDVVQDYTTDKALLLSAIDGLYARGTTALYDATLAGIELAADAPSPRRAVVVLSDGGEYGGTDGSPASASTREDSVRASTVRGVPVYTIGLGWNIDQRFLEEIATSSSGSFFESPTTDELAGVYDTLAFLFRTQYIVTLDVDVPADGATYDFELTVDAEAGSASDTGSLRAPIPVPQVALPAGLFDAPLSEPTTVTVDVAADDDIASIAYRVGDAVISTESSATIDPATIAPGMYTLAVDVTDVDGDTGTLNADFEIAALPPTLSSDFAPSSELSEPTVVTVTAGGQTDISEVSFVVDGDVVATDTEQPYEFTIEPSALSPEEHVLTVSVLNAGGQTSAQDTAFAVAALAPVVEVSGLVDGQVIEDDAVVDVNASGQTEITLIDVAYDGGDSELITGTSFTVPAETLGNGNHELAVVVTNAGGQSTSVTVPFVVDVPPVPTSTPAPTSTPEIVPTETAQESAAAVDEQATADAQSTADAQASEEAANAQSPADAQASEEAANAQSTADAQASEEAANAQSTADVEVVETEEPTAELTDEIVPTSTDAPDETSVEDPTAQPSLTPVTMTEVDATTADVQETDDGTTAIIAVGVGLLLLVLLFLFLRGRRRD
jgi:VWFA-related protein